MEREYNYYSEPAREKPNIELLNAISLEVRKRAFETILNAGSGHLGGSSSSVELLVALYFGNILRFDPLNPRHHNRDRVLIRGHEGPLRYSIFSLIGWVAKQELSTYRRLGSRLQGHESMQHVPGVDITPSGSLGMLLSYGVGSAVAAKENGQDFRVFVFLGDGEEQEGNVSEAARHAATVGLDNLICILDKNEKQLSRVTKDSDGAADIGKIWEGYGWQVEKISNGHDLEEILSVYKKLEKINKPTLIIAHTIKGYGLDGAVENYCGYHTLSTSTPETVKKGIRNLEYLLSQEGWEELSIEKGVSQILLHNKTLLPQREQVSKKFTVDIKVNPENNTHLENCQSHYHSELRKLLKQEGAPRLYIMTADFIRQDIAEMLELTEFSRYLDVGIREQHLIATAHGISTTDPDSRIFISYGDAFIYRASDQINAAVQGGSRMIITGERSGVCQEKNGESHQTSGQPGVFLTMPGAYFFEPADVQDLYNIFNWAFTNNPGVVYVRLHHANVQPLERNKEDAKNINFYITHDPDKPPKLIYVASGLLVESAVQAAKKLELENNIGVRVINVVNLKSLDKSFADLSEAGIPLLTLYNGNPAILKSVVSAAVLENQSSRPSIIKSHGFEFGTSGSLSDLMKYFKFDCDGITEVTRKKFPNLERIFE